MSSRGDVALSRPMRVALRVYFVVFLVVLYLPTTLLVIFSFNDSNTASFPLTGFTTRFYSAAFHDDTIVGSVETSLKIAVVVGVIATALGLSASYALARRKIVLKGPIAALLLVPLVVPTVAFGIAMLILFKQPWSPVSLGLTAVIIGHVVLAIPYTILLILPRIGSIDLRLEEAAQDLGASGAQTFRRVIFPLITPSLLAAFLISFITSVDEVVVANFLLSNGQLTYPVYLFAGLRQPDRVAVLIPVASVMIVLSFLIAFIAEMMRRRGERRLGLSS